MTILRRLCLVTIVAFTVLAIAKTAHAQTIEDVEDLCGGLGVQEVKGLIAIRDDWDNIDQASGIGEKDGWAGYTDFAARLASAKRAVLQSADLRFGLGYIQRPDIFLAADTVNGDEEHGLIHKEDIDAYVLFRYAQLVSCELSDRANDILNIGREISGF